MREDGSGVTKCDFEWNLVVKQSFQIVRFQSSDTRETMKNWLKQWSIHYTLALNTEGTNKHLYAVHIRRWTAMLTCDINHQLKWLKTSNIYMYIYISALRQIRQIALITAINNPVTYLVSTINRKLRYIKPDPRPSSSRHWLCLIRS